MTVKSISGRVPCVFPHERVRLAAVNVATIADLKDNISGAPGDLTITITNNIPVSAADAIPVITAGKNITLTSDSGNHKIYRIERNTSRDTGMFTVNGGSLKIDTSGGGTLTLDGGSDGNWLNYGTSGITGNDQSLVFVNSGTFTLDGGNIVNNTALEVHEETINWSYGLTQKWQKKDRDAHKWDRVATGYGGGVAVTGMYMDETVFTMSGGTISGNWIPGATPIVDDVTDSIGDSDGGVYVYWSRFQMIGGTISGNRASIGGGVSFRSTGETNSIRMEGSAIIDRDNEVYFWTDNNRLEKTYIEVDGQMNAGSGALNITPGYKIPTRSW